MTTSLTSGMPRRETCTHAPPSRAGLVNVASGLSARAWRTLAVAQVPTMLPSALLTEPFTQAIGSSSAIDVTLYWPIGFGTLPPVGLRRPVASSGPLMRSKMLPRRTARSVSWIAFGR